MNNTKRKSCRQESTGFSFWFAGRDTLRPHRFDRSERLRKICVARDYTVRKGYRAFAAASTNPAGSYPALIPQPKQKPTVKVGLVLAGE